MPSSRRVMAVPFVGKDVPSRSSEFAHPDVLIDQLLLRIVILSAQRFTAYCYAIEARLHSTNWSTDG